jgi:hypothetical protein
MCKFASFVLTKDGVFWSDKSDSHEDIISEHGLHADGIRGPNILRVEIVPGSKIKKFSQYKDWEYRIDQDRMPSWFDAPKDEKRARQALKDRAKKGFLTVDASGCTALTQLDTPVAKTVDASGCTALTQLDTPVAEYVDASGCTALTQLDTPVAEYVYASGCTALTHKKGKA